ncbi:MAG: YifB family Mg chelatase-like AAA ATPase [Bacteroidaceae bacterium]|nr:YifB family Mg chelatase-like AAA ATPase [Bacteroidaceae bacterium]
MLTKLNSAAVDGIKAIPVVIEVHTVPSTKETVNSMTIVGLPDNSVRESHSRIDAAIANTGIRLPNQRITINLAPADVRKEGTGFDLPIALGILAANSLISHVSLEKYMVVAELSLDGSLQSIRGALPIAIKARELGYDGLIIPEQNVHEAAVVNRLKVYGARNLQQVINFLNGVNSDDQLQPTVIDTRAEFFAHQNHYDIDFADVRGQENVKRAFEVAAAGSHNLILIGPPGAGKSMLAKRLPTILPPLSLAESLETTQIHSVAGRLKGGTGLITERPFQAPHHTVSQVALVGGGANPMPGEISLAHNGVLFLDELPEFSRASLEVLRQPLEDRQITVSRAKYSIVYPCNFMFVASMNPCPCGYYTHPTKRCECTPGQIHRYLNKISGPLMDRIDIQCEILPVSFSELSKMQPGESSAVIRERIIKARKIQEERFSSFASGAGTDGSRIHCNAQMTEKMLHQFAEPDAESMDMLRMAMERLKLSARAYSRILKVARTIADLAGSEKVESTHIAEAIGYRNLDRGDWAERGM